MALTVSVGSGDNPLTPRIVREPGFTLVGISARTTNAKEISGQGVIGKLWDRFIKVGRLARTLALSPLGERVGRRRRFLQPGRAG